ncbi:MAG: hypothetical protein M1829_000536 [Trizodia sp. TS-e1964]|nr:MAG: hypothetical protein M1829_000536 [Trizodia sp. TS-e1964]
MLKTKSLNKLLAQNTSPAIPTIIIFTPSGHLIAYASPFPPKILRIQTTLASNIWTAYSNLASEGTIAAACAHLAYTPAAAPTNPSPDASSASVSAPAPQATPALPASSVMPPTSTPAKPDTDHIKTLTLEFAHANISFHLLRSRLVLALIGSSTSDSSQPILATLAVARPPSATGFKEPPDFSVRIGKDINTPPSLPTRDSSGGSSAGGPRKVVGPGSGALGVSSSYSSAKSHGASLLLGRSPHNAAASTPTSRASLERQDGSAGAASAAEQHTVGLGILRTKGEALARWLSNEIEGFEMPEVM